MKKQRTTTLTIILSILFVIILVLTVASGTYAYFQAQASNSNIQGGTATAPDLELEVKRISINANDNLIPLDNDADNLTIAVKGYGFSGTSFDSTKSCLDKNGYSVCQIYEIRIKNNSTAAVVLNGGITHLAGAETPNIACAVMESNIKVTSNQTCNTETALAQNKKFNSGEETKYYIIVYINNLHTIQYDTGDFFGTVKFSSINGGITADFE